MDTTAPKRRISLRHLLLIAGLGLGVLIVAAVAYVVFDPLGGSIGDPFSQEIAGLPAATSTAVVDLHDGDTFDLTLSPVQKRIGNATVRIKMQADLFYTVTFIVTLCVTNARLVMDRMYRAAQRRAKRAET